jgi:hypothetical protein
LSRIASEVWVCANVRIGLRDVLEFQNLVDRETGRIFAGKLIFSMTTSTIGVATRASAYSRFANGAR